MFVSKIALPRRTFLRGMGATLALPLLDAMVPALTAQSQTAARPIRRLGFIYMPNGVARNFSGINYWTPLGEGSSFEFSPILKPLEPFRDRMVVISGLAQHQADAHDDGANGDHTRGTSTWLTGARPKHTEGSDVKNGISADQIAAQQFGRDTPLPSLELALDVTYLAGNCENGYSCAYMNTLSWRTPETPLPMKRRPFAASAFSRRIVSVQSALPPSITMSPCSSRGTRPSMTASVALPAWTRMTILRGLARDWTNSSRVFVPLTPPGVFGFSATNLSVFSVVRL